MVDRLTTKEQIEQLKALTIRFGVIHEAQALQLKMWPLLMPGVASAEAVVDVETCTVTYKCLTSKGKGFRKTKKVILFCNHLKQWTQVLLWEDTKVAVTVDGQTIFGDYYETKTSAS